MKTIRRIAALVLVCFVAVAFAGCEAVVEALEDKDLRESTEAMLDAIIEDDVDSAYAIVDETCTKEEFATVFDEIEKLFDDSEDYDISVLYAYRGKNVSSEGTVDVSTASYKVSISSGVYVVEVEKVSSNEDLNSFYIVPYEMTDYYSVGALDNMSNASVFQWLVLLSNLIIVGVVVFAFIDCCRQKLKLKALWLILIALGVVTLGLTFSATNLNFNFNASWFFAYNAFITYGGGTNTIRFMMPIGAILYFALRNSMIEKNQNYDNYPGFVQPMPPAYNNSAYDDNLNP